MKTIVVNVPDKHQKLLTRLFRNLRLKSKVLTAAKREELAMANWINEGMDSEEVSEKEIMKVLKKHGVEI